MPRIFMPLVALFPLVWVCSSAVAHPGHAHRAPVKTANEEATQGHERTWTDASGAFHLHGTFVSAQDGCVQIRRGDDSLVNLKLSQLTESDQHWVEQRLAEIRQVNEVQVQISRPVFRLLVSDGDDQLGKDILTANELPLLLAQRDQKQARAVADESPGMAKAFEAFAKLNAIKTRWDDRYFYVESNGIPDHRMMVGITAWQQQVPLPQPYTGNNAWRIPLYPVEAKNPLSAKSHFFRGAIALAVNGIPIFNPIKNDGKTDTLLAGELDEFGGHCGRADDYHYHIAPVHLQKAVGKGLPIAYALDGYPIYGYEEPDGSPIAALDAFNGHKDKNGNYHYHATKAYPYLNGGFHGEVVERDGQVDPQPQAGGVRPALPPLRGAKIIDFVETKPGSFRLTYDVSGKKGTVSYTLGNDGSAKFVFVDTSGNSTTENYTPRQRGPGGNDRPPPRPGENPATKKKGKQPPQGKTAETNENPPREVSAKPPGNLSPLVVTSAALDAKGFISSEYTCDGASASPPVEWKQAPSGTKCFALSLWHVAPDQEKSYWLVYNIPSNVTQLTKNAKDIGKVGLNDKRRAEYDPMCSKGPGVKKYHITIYALSAEPNVAADKATRANFLTAIKDITLAEGTLDFQYERPKE